jgi:hypothetical protein
MRTVRDTLVLLPLLLSLCSCSAYMAANKEGVDLDDLQACQTRACVQANGGAAIETSSSEEGELVEIYKIQKETGHTGRAVMHGVFSVATLGMWELVGTPIEGAQQKAEYVAVRVTSDSKTGQIKQLEILE